MQKRTNPLELKLESKDYTPAPTNQEETQENQPQFAQAEPVAQPIHTPEMPSAPVQEQAATPPVQPVEPAVSEETAQPQVAEPAAKEEQPKPAALAPDRVAPVRPNRPAPVRPVLHHAAEDRIRHGEHVADNDTALAIKFRVSGDHVDRRMVLTRVSRDVCKLAQALYPEQSLGSIIESALLTRAFLQDRDAFDEMAREIIKKGGKIKC